MGMANIASFLMMFLSGIFFPTSGFPEWLLPVSQVLPLTYFVNGMRDGMAYGSGLLTGDFWMGIGILAIWGVLTFAIGSMIYRRGNSLIVFSKSVCPLSPLLSGLANGRFLCPLSPSLSGLANPVSMPIIPVAQWVGESSFYAIIPVAQWVGRLHFHYPLSLSFNIANYWIFPERSG